MLTFNVKPSFIMEYSKAHWIPWIVSCLLLYNALEILEPLSQTLLLLGKNDKLGPRNQSWSEQFKINEI